MLIVDAHEDIAYNMLTFGRDYRFSAAEIRRREQGSQIPACNGDALLGWPDYQKGKVAVVFGTLFVPPSRHAPENWDFLRYTSVNEAHLAYRRELESYHRLADESPDFFRLIHTQADLQDVLEHWNDSSQEEHPVGLVVLMEGAEGVRSPSELEMWWQMGVRLIGPAWAGTRFCGGTREPGPLTSEGFALLDGMADLGFTLDLSHMDVKAALQALDHYPAGIIASHANAQALLKGLDSNRHLPDEVIRGLIARNGVIGIVPLNTFLLPGWRNGDDRSLVSLREVVAQVDYICQMAGNALHVGIGSDFDGGFGWQSVPIEIDTIADLQKLEPILLEKGYSSKDIACILGKNWLNHLYQLLPEDV